VHQLVRSRVPTLDNDRSPSSDIVAIAELIESRALDDVCNGRVK
jgi:histidine ammonia-lyase